MSETKPYIMQNSDLFELAEKDGNLNFYAKLDKNTDLNYYEFSPNAPQEINTAEFKHLQTKENVSPKIKKLAKTDELRDNFECA